MDKRKVALGIGTIAAAASYFFWRASKKKAASTAAPTITKETIVTQAALPSVPTTDMPVQATESNTSVKSVQPMTAATSYVMSGDDTWASVAKQVYGDARWWPFLWDQNSAAYPNPDKLSAGRKSITVPPKSSLPVGKQAQYFARATEHARIWAAHRKSRDFGKKLPELPASVTTPTE